MADTRTFTTTVATIPSGTVAKLLKDTDSTYWAGGWAAYPTTLSADANVLQVVDLTHGLPVQPQTSSTWAVTQSGSWTVAATQSGTWTVTGTGGTFPVTDSGGSLTVDAPVGTPVFVRLSDGSSAITTLPVSLASVPSHAVTNAGTFVVQVDGTALTRLTDIETNTDSLAVVGNGAAATALRVTLANDSTGILATVGAVTSITNAVTVAQATAANLNCTEASAAAIKTAVEVIDNFISGSRGLVTEDNSAAIAASLSVVDDWDETNRCAVNPISGQVGVAGGSGTVGATTQRVVLASDERVVENGASASVPGLTMFLSAALTNTAQAVKASAGRLYAVHVENPNSAKSYVQLYNVASGSVTVGTTTPDKTLYIPPNGAYDFSWEVPVAFGTAISVAATTTATGGSAPSSNLLINVDYK